jgi:uncharacterized protein with NRDE domain
MCLIYVAWRVDPFYRLVVAANRDEYHARPSVPAHWWDEAGGILAGRDLEAGGTWMGVSRGGRFAAITNYRDPARRLPAARSRGALVSAFLRGGTPALQYLDQVAGVGGRYNGFTLIVCDGERLGWYSNHGGAPDAVAPGVHGLSNELLDSPWPKVEEGKLELLSLLAGRPPTPGDLLGLLDRRDPHPDETLPDTGVGLERERLLSPRFILGSEYGTRCSTVLMVSAAGEVVFRERSFDAAGEACGDVVHSFRVEAGA